VCTWTAERGTRSRRLRLPGAGPGAAGAAAGAAAGGAGADERAAQRHAGAARAACGRGGRGGRRRGLRHGAAQRRHDAAAVHAARCGDWRAAMECALLQGANSVSEAGWVPEAL